mgnify:CR=1 FL=1
MNLPSLKSWFPQIFATALILVSSPAIWAGEAPATRQLLVVAPGYWKAGEAKSYTFDVFDLDAGGKRIHHAAPAQVGEIRGLAFSPATQRLYVAGHEGLLCYDWMTREQVWIKPVEGPKTEQNDAIAITLDGSRIYTIRHFAKGMNVYDAATGDRLRVIHEDRMPMWGRFSQVSHDGRRLFASNGAIFMLDVTRPDQEPILGQFKPVAEPVRFALTPDGHRFIYATGAKRSLAIHDAADGRLLHEVAIPAWDGMVTEKASLQWLALNPDGRQAWACDPANACLHRFDLSTEPPSHLGRVAVEKGTEGLMFSVDGRFLITGAGAMLDPATGTPTGQLCDESGKPLTASNNLLALEAAGARGVRTNQQCAPVWPGSQPGQPVSTTTTPEKNAPIAAPPVTSPAGPAGEVVIAKSVSAHRDLVAESLRAELVAAGLTCRVIPLAELPQVDPAACRNIVVLTDVPDWNKTKSVGTYLKDKDATVAKKLIVVTMANKATWKAPRQDVDAITGASKKEDHPAQVAAIRDRILKSRQP